MRELRGSSRTFYLSLICFPEILRKQISIAYLFCKIADNIVDLNHFPENKKHNILKEFCDLVKGLLSPDEFIKRIENDGLVRPGGSVLYALPAAMDLFRQFSKEDQSLILEVFQSVLHGMEFDLSRQAIKDEAELDQYCYDVAGSAGCFLTKLFYQYQFLNRNHEKMILLGVQLGKGLQLTNIIRDQKEDTDNTRIYLPPGQDFAADSNIFRKAVLCLDSGLEYVLFLPKRSWRIRLASLWPVLFALKTILGFAKSPDRRGPRKIKISRPEIYMTIIISVLFIFSNKAIEHYFESIRKRIPIS